MKHNMGGADRAIRVIVAIILAALYLTDTVTGTLGIVFIVLAIYFVLTSIFRFCPGYLPFGLSTMKASSAPSPPPAVPTPPEAPTAPPPSELSQEQEPPTTPGA